MIRFLQILKMVFLAILIGNIHVNAQKYTTVERTDGYQLKSSVPTTKSALATSAIVDSLKIGDTQSQTDHNLTGVNMTSGTNSGRNWIESNNGWFSFDLASDSVVMQELNCTYWGSDAGKRGFDIYVSGVKVSFQKLNNNSPKNFFDVTYAIPLSLTRHKSKVTIKFQSDSIAGGLYGCKIIRSAEPGRYWPANIHDPSSIIKCGDTYWVFGTGDGVNALRSKDMVSWQAGPTPFAKWDIPAYIKQYVPKFEGTYWAPECFYMNGKYYLYYSASEWGTKLSCIGLTINETLDPNNPKYKWVDQGLIVSSNHGTNYNAIDPAIMRDPKTGKIWMSYGSFNEAGIKVLEIDSVTGKPVNLNSQVSIANNWVGPKAWDYNGEGACMIYHNKYYYLFLNFGGCCAGVTSTYYIVVGRATSPTGPFYDKNGQNLYKVGSAGGGSVFLKHDDTKGAKDRFYGPGHFGYFVENGTEYFTFHYYDANFPYPAPANIGGPMLAIGKIKWDSNNWPVASFDWVDKGRYQVTNVNSKLYWEASQTSTLIQNSQSLYHTQLWDFYPLGTGEYKIVNASSPTLGIEPVGANRDGLLKMATYKDSVYQKYRILKSVNNELWFYQSKGLLVIEVPWASASSNVQLGLWWFNTLTCQQWKATRIGDIPTAVRYSNSKNITVYPNPAIDVLTVDGLDQSAKLDFYDISGKLVYSKQISESGKNVDISSLPFGIYQVTITDKDGISIHKIVKQ